MASLSLPTLVEPRRGTAPAEAVLLVTGFGDPVAADYAAFVAQRGERCVVVDAASCRRAGMRIAAAVVFLPARLTDADRANLDDLLTLAASNQAESFTLISSARVHLDDKDAIAVETYAFQRANGLRDRTVIVRTGNILSRHSRTGVRLRMFSACFPLLPVRLRSCCVDGDELFEMIETVRQSPRTRRVYTLLGPNRPWRDLLADHRSRNVIGICITAICGILSLLLVGHLAGLVLNFLGYVWPSLRRDNFDTLRPRSLRELIALTNPYNRRYVQVVGYNNGVTHFGHRYPGRTVVSTVRCDRVERTSSEVIRADCGATIRKALDFLAPSGQELFVIPNYSYVSLGTAFFVPIHGSAADYSTVAETITDAVFYDPASDRVISATRDDPLFRDLLYNMKSDAVLLQLHLRVKPKSRYFLRKQELEEPTHEDLLRALRDKQATNVEVRKARAGDSKVTLYTYYNDPGDAASPVLELPRDRLGRLWDRLEENAVTSFLMHALTRHFAWHVELFFTDEEFRTFWETHRGLRLRKIQLRYIRCDGFPKSPFREHDCVSADLFMFRRHRRRFEAYLKQTFAVVRSNPGKHSR